MITIQVQNKNPLLIRMGVYGLALSCCICAAQENNNAGAVAEKPAKSERECRTTRSIGSKMRRSFCLSKEEWAMVDAQNQELDSVKQKDKDIFFRRAIQQGGLSTGDILDNPNSPGP